MYKRQLYSRATGAKVRVKQQPSEVAPSVKPIKIGKKKYGSFEEVRAARDNAVAQREAVAKFVTDPDLLKEQALAENVPEEYYQRKMFEEVQRQDKIIGKLNAYLPETKTEEVTAEAPTPASEFAPLEAPAEQVAPKTSAEISLGAVEEPHPIGVSPAEAPAEGVAAVEIGVPKEPIETTPKVIPEAVTVDAAKPEVLQPQRTVPPPEPRPFTPEYKAKMDKVYEALSKDIDKIAPPEVKLKLVDLIESKPGLLIRGVEYGAKTETGVERVIELSRGIFDPNATVEDMVKRMTEDLNHEIIHALRNMGLFRKAEWNVLSKSALNAKVPKKSYTYLDRANAIYRPNGIPIAEVYASDEALIEEAIADMYKDWVKNRQAPQQAQGLLNRVTEFFRRIFRALKSTQHEEVFKSIEAGKLREREASPAQEMPKATTEERFSAAPAVDSEEFRKWFSGSKAVNPDGTPKVFYHGTSKDIIFDKFKAGQRGIWFTDDPASASQYAVENDSMGFKRTKGWDFEAVNTASRVIPVYLSYKNPYTLTEDDIKTLNRSENYSKAQRDLFNRVRAKDPTVDAIDFADGVVVVFDPSQAKSTLNPFEPGTAESKKFSAAPLPPYVEQRNRTLFRPQPDIPFYKSMFDFFFGHPTTGKVLNSPIYGNIDMSAATRFATSARVAGVDKNAYVEYLEKANNQAQNLGFERSSADYSAVAALTWFQRSSQLAASVIMMGKPSIKFDRAGDIQSATIAAEEDPDSLMNVFKILLEPGPTDSVTRL